MKIVVRPRDHATTPALLGRVESRLGLVLGRFGERIDRVGLRISSSNEAGGLSQILCRVEVFLRPRSVRVVGRGPDLLAAVERAAARASRSVERALERERASEEPGR